MLNRPLHLPPQHLYPTDAWQVRETRYSERYFARAETAFSLSNGYIGIRGTFDEGRPALSPGTFVNGFHETWPIVHAEQAYGLARTGQTIVTVPDATVLRLFVDDEPLFMPTARLRHYARTLDMRDGTLSRELAWSTPSGKHVLVRSRRLVSFEHRHLVAIEYEVEMRDRCAPIVICCPVADPRNGDALMAGRDGDPRAARRMDHRVLTAEVAEAAGDRMLLGYRTANSGMTLGMAIDHVAECEGPIEATMSADSGHMELVVTAAAEPGVPIRVTKLAAYHSSRSEAPAELLERCGWTLERGRRLGA
jgi:alpha,alpha-trehalose phosphorylase